MPRTGDLLILSREHHAALVLARAARKAIENNDDAIARTTVVKLEAYGRDVMAAHFVKEEQLLQIEPRKLDDETIARIFSEHAELRMLCCHSDELDVMERLQRFASLMVTHVRFEERVIFPQLQIEPVVAEKKEAD